MEEEQGEDSEVLDAMDGWDSEEENQSSGGAANNNTGTSPAADAAGDKKWAVKDSFCSREKLCRMGQEHKQYVY